MAWYLLTKKALYKMDGAKAVERIRSWPSLTSINTRNLAPDDLIVDLERADPELVPIQPPQSGNGTDVSAQPPKPPGTSAPKPPVTWRKSPNFSARSSRIERIILHYTTGPTAEGALSWFENPASQVSAHYVIDKDGTIYQCVSDERKAWHAFGENDDSIGIEHVARKGDRLTPSQSEQSAKLIAYLKAQYHLNNGDVTAHRFTKANVGRTDCPGDLWKTEAELKSWLNAVVPDGAVSAPASKPSRVVRVTRNTSAVYVPPGPWVGLNVIEVFIGDEKFRCVSGLRNAQTFRKMGEGVPGSGEPVEQGTYKPSDILWKGGKDNYNSLWSEGLGAWVIDLIPQDPTRRSAIEFHCDLNRSSSPGTMGCIGIAPEDQKRFIAAWRAVEPTSVVVDWNLA